MVKFFVTSPGSAFGYYFGRLQLHNSVAYLFECTNTLLSILLEEPVLCIVYGVPNYQQHAMQFHISVLALN